MILNDTAAKVMGFGNPVGEVVGLFGRKQRYRGSHNMVNNDPYKEIRPPPSSQAAPFGQYVSQVIDAHQTRSRHEYGARRNGAIFKKYNPASPFI